MSAHSIERWCSSGQNPLPEQPLQNKTRQLRPEVLAGSCELACVSYRNCSLFRRVECEPVKQALKQYMSVAGPTAGEYASRQFKPKPSSKASSGTPAPQRKANDALHSSHGRTCAKLQPNFKARNEQCQPRHPACPLKNEFGSSSHADRIVKLFWHQRQYLYQVPRLVRVVAVVVVVVLSTSY